MANLTHDIARKWDAEQVVILAISQKRGRLEAASSERQRPSVPRPGSCVMWYDTAMRN